MASKSKFVARDTYSVQRIEYRGMYNLRFEISNLRLPAVSTIVENPLQIGLLFAKQSQC